VQSKIKKLNLNQSDSMQSFIRALTNLVKMGLLVVGMASLVNLSGCACKNFVTDEGSAAVQHAERLNVEFQEKGVRSTRNEAR